MSKSNPTMAPNKLDVIKKALSGKKGFTIPEQINENEGHLYHLLILDGGTRTSQDEILYKARVQKVNVETFARSQKNGDYNRLGYTNIHILHDPVDGDNKPAASRGDNKPAAEVIESLKSIDSIGELEALKLADTRKTVVEAIELRIAELNK